MSKDDPDRFDRAVMAWHASPHDFDEFGPMRKVSGSGQGAAVYGRGAAYVAENPKVSGPGESEYMKEFAHHPSLEGAQKWQIKNLDDSWEDLLTDAHDEQAKPDTIYEQGRHDFGRSWVLSHLSNHDMQRDPQALDLLRDMIRAGKDRQTVNPKRRGSIVEDLTAFMNQRLWWIPDDAKRTEYDDNHANMVADYLEKHADQELRHVKDPGKQGPFSYKVAVHLRPETILDWDTVLSSHHPEALDKVNQAFGRPEADWASNVQRIFGQVKDHTTYDGRSIYNALRQVHGSDYDASEALFNAGIHGIRYKDEGSRNPKPTLYLDDKPHPTTPAYGYDDIGVGIAHRVRHDWRFQGLSKFGVRQTYVQELDNAKDELETVKRLSAAEPSYVYLGTGGVPELERQIKHIQDTIDWLNKNDAKLEMKYPKPTYNYVIFHPDFVEALAQYNIKGEKIRDIGPGVHLKAVDHDPFKGEAK